MIGDQFVCARPNCNNVGVKATHNQKFCSTECCRIETNRKIMEKYHERAAIKRGKKRVCKTCDTSLSRYNTESTCGSCQMAARVRNSNKVSALVGSVSWL